MSTPDEGSGDDPSSSVRSVRPRPRSPRTRQRATTRSILSTTRTTTRARARPDGFHGVTPSWNIILNSMLYMAAPLSMPATTAAGGWFWSFVFWAYCSCATYWTGLVVGRAYNANPSCDLSTYPRMAGEAFARLSLRRDPSDALAARAAPKGHRSPRLHPNSSPSTSTPSPRSYSSPSTSRRSSRRPACPWVWLLVVWIATVPVVQIPTFHASRWIVVPAFAVLVASVCLFFAEIFVVAPWDCDPGPTFLSPDAVVSLRLLANFAYAYGGHGMFPESLREMRRPKDWPRVMRWCYGRDGAAVPGVRRRRISRVRRLRQGERQPQFSGQPSQRRVAGFANPADVLPRLLHQRRHDHRRGTTRARNRTRIRGRGRSRRDENLDEIRVSNRVVGVAMSPRVRIHVQRLGGTSSSTRRRSREPWE